MPSSLRESYQCLTGLVVFSEDLLNHRLRPPNQWRQKFNNYMSTVPSYYAQVSNQYSYLCCIALYTVHKLSNESSYIPHYHKYVRSTMQITTQYNVYIIQLVWPSQCFVYSEYCWSVCTSTTQSTTCWSVCIALHRAVHSFTDVCIALHRAQHSFTAKVCIALHT